MQKFPLPPTMVGALTQSYIKNGGNKIGLHKTLTIVIPCLLKWAVTYFNEVWSLKKHEAAFLNTRQNLIFVE